MEKSKNNIMSILKIMACIAVFSGHVLNDITGTAPWSGESQYFKQLIYVVIFRADFGLIIFFTCSGFLISYFYNNNVLKKIIKYTIKLLIPSIIIILLTALIYYILGFFGDNSFNLCNIKSDINNLLFLNGTTYYAGQLWYIPVQIQYYIMCSLFLYIVHNNTRTKKEKLFYLLCSIIVAGLLHKWYFLCVIIGLLGGNIAKEYNSNNKFKVIIIIVIAILMGIFVPQIYISYCHNWDESMFSWGFYYISIFVSILLILGSNVFVNNNNLLNFLSKYTFPIFMIHKLIISLFIKASNYFKFSYSIIFDYIIILVVTILFSMIFNYFNELLLKKLNNSMG